MNQTTCPYVWSRGETATTDTDVLYVIAVVSNPAQFTRRYTLFEEFVQRMSAEPQIQLVTLELQQGARPFVTSAPLQFRTHHELWHKENMINLAVQHLPPDWKYLAWIDADIQFTNPDWVRETLDQLQTFDLVQMFTHAIDLGPRYETMQVHHGFMYQYLRGEPPATPYAKGKHWHPGYAWAVTKHAWDAMGGLIDFAILGSADDHMARAWVGMHDENSHKNLHPNYRNMLLAFQERCEASIRRNVGYVNGTILHSFHGAKRFRFYRERWKILVEHAYDPIRDLKRDAMGVLQLQPAKFKLRDDIRKYFRSRNEDSVDWEE